MQKLFKSSVLVIFLLVVQVINAQGDIRKQNTVDSANQPVVHVKHKKSRAYGPIFKKIQAHQQEVALLDILSSDENADFNCSAGFCTVSYTHLTLPTTSRV